MAVGFTGTFLKLVCRHFLDDAVSSVLNVGVIGTSGSTGVFLEERIEIV